MGKSKPAATAGEMSFEQGLDTLLAAATKSGTAMSLASALTDNWRYMDFCDVGAGGRPCLPMEWLFGTRGLLAGRLVVIVADEAVGKSSLMYLLYGMLQRTCGLWSAHYDTEEALMPPDRIWRLGCDPRKLLTINPGSLEAATEEMKQFVKEVRTNVDPDKKLPIAMGLDSVSAAAASEIDVITGSSDGDNSIGKHARLLSGFLRNQLRYLAANHVAIIFTDQWRANVNTDPRKGGNPHKTKTFIAENPQRFHASWILDLRKYKMTADIGEGDRVMIRTDKNKLGPKQREVEAWLFRDRPGGECCWDFNKANINLLFGSYSPFREGQYKSGGGWYSHQAINEGKNMRDVDFVNAFYKNSELVMECREALKIRGFGFDFEKAYTADSFDTDNEQEPEDVK